MTDYCTFFIISYIALQLNTCTIEHCQCLENPVTCKNQGNTGNVTLSFPVDLPRTRRFLK